MEAWQNFVVVLTPSGTTVVLTMLWRDNSTQVTMAIMWLQHICATWILSTY